MDPEIVPSSFGHQSPSQGQVVVFHLSYRIGLIDKMAKRGAERDLNKDNAEEEEEEEVEDVRPLFNNRSKWC